MNEYAHGMVMMEVAVRVTKHMRMNYLWDDMEEWGWKDEMIKRHFEHFE